MKYGKKSKLIVITSLALTIFFCIGATAIGAYTASTSDKLADELINIQPQQSKIDKGDAVIDQIEFTAIDGMKAGIIVTFSNQCESNIEDIFIKIKLPNSEINADYSTKGNPSWRLNSGYNASFTWGLSYNKADYFTIAIESYTTIEGVMHKVSDDDIKWIQFFYPGKDNILENYQAKESKEIFTTKINESLYGKQYFPINLSAGDTCTAHLSWNGKGAVYLVYVGSNDFDSDKNGDLVLSSFFKSGSEDIKYQFQNDKASTFTVPKDGLYVLPVKDNSNGEITNVSGEISYPAY